MKRIIPFQHTPADTAKGAVDLIAYAAEFGLSAKHEDTELEVDGDEKAIKRFLADLEIFELEDLAIVCPKCGHHI